MQEVLERLGITEDPVLVALQLTQTAEAVAEVVMLEDQQMEVVVYVIYIGVNLFSLQNKTIVIPSN